MTVPSGRGRTRPVTATQNSLRSVSATANVAARSGSYLDVAGAIGAACAMLVLLVALFAQVFFPALAVAIEVPLVFALATWLAHRTPALLRALVTSGRRAVGMKPVSAGIEPDGSVNAIAQAGGTTPKAISDRLRRIRHALLQCIQRQREGQEDQREQAPEDP